jgi:hypothetical protein
MRRIYIPRAVAIKLARELTAASTTQLGTAFGGRDHTTIMWSIRRELPESDWEILISVYNQFAELPQFRSCRGTVACSSCNWSKGGKTLLEWRGFE